MRCPFCLKEDTQVKDSRPSDDGVITKRRRLCNNCGSRFTTIERVQMREIYVVKKSGQIRPFNRQKLTDSILHAVRKRPVSTEQVEIVVNQITKNIEGSGENEINTDIIGQYIMESLAKIDTVSYIRFASVYKQFREAKDFEDFIGEIEKIVKI